MNPIEQQIIAVVQARSAALVAGDVAALERILHPDFVYVNSQGHKTTRADYLGRFAHPDGGPKWEQQELSEIEVHRHGDTAIVTCRVHDVANWGEYHLDAVFRSTFVYIQAAEGWRCVAGHTSEIAAETE